MEKAIGVKSPCNRLVAVEPLDEAVGLPKGPVIFAHSLHTLRSCLGNAPSPLSQCPARSPEASLHHVFPLHVRGQASPPLAIQAASPLSHAPERRDRVMTARRNAALASSPQIPAQAGSLLKNMPERRYISGDAAGVSPKQSLLAHAFDNDEDRRAAFAKSGAARLRPAACGAAPLPRETAEADPWAGCEDLAREGLIEWEEDFLRLRASRVQDPASSPGSSAAGSARSSCARPYKFDAFQRESIGTMSTASSLGDTRPSALGSICSTASSLVPAAQGRAAAEAWRPAAEEWEPAEEDQASGGGESDNDWELEFMIRAGFDA